MEKMQIIEVTKEELKKIIDFDYDDENIEELIGKANE